MLFGEGVRTSRKRFKDSDDTLIVMQGNGRDGSESQTQAHYGINAVVFLRVVAAQSLSRAKTFARDAGIYAEASPEFRSSVSASPHTHNSAITSHGECRGVGLRERVSGFGDRTENYVRIPSRIGDCIAQCLKYFAWIREVPGCWGDRLIQEGRGRGLRESRGQNLSHRDYRARVSLRTRPVKWVWAKV